MKKRLSSRIVLVVLLLVLGVSGLGAHNRPVAAQDSELTLWVYDDGRLEVLNQLGADFEAEYGVKLTVEVVDLSEIRNAMTLGAASGEGPDMIIIPHDNLGPFVENGSAAPIDLGDKAADFLPNAIDGFTYNGQLYGVPLAVENIGFFRNTDLVPEAPATWADVAEIGAALLDEGKIRLGHWSTRLDL